MRVIFEKVQGLGNDFVLIDARAGGILCTPAQARLLCDRRRGVGADGVLTLLPSAAPGADARLQIQNADGSLAQMCGNGLRCAARHLFEGQREPTPVVLETPAGLLRCDARQGLIRADLGTPRVGPNETLVVSGEPIVGRAVSLGNPHFVVFARGREGVGRTEPLADSARRLGPSIERHPRFAPDRTNVEFYEPWDDGLRCAVWERGSGLTEACGTGAGATAAAALADGRWPVGRPVPVDLPGGRLFIERLSDGDLGQGLGEPGLAIVGPAARVYRGEIELSDLP